jgi:endonuclease V-like protein UPF0215 family
MQDLIRNFQLYGFNNSSIGKICVAKCEEENGQIIIIQGIAMKTCVLFNIINHRQDHRNVTSQILPVCLPLKADVLAVSIEKYSFDVY